MNINFRANKISTQQVIYRNIIGRYSVKDVALVKLDLKSKRDIVLLKKLKNKWQLTFASEIFRDAKKGYADGIFALTTQKNNFYKLKSKNVLGIAEINNINNEKINLEYLQTNPKYQFEEEKENHKRKVIGTGSAIMNYLKNQPNVSKIVAHPVFSAIDFYIKQGFKMYDEDMLEYSYIWEKQRP